MKSDRSEGIAPAVTLAATPKFSAVLGCGMYNADALAAVRSVAPVFSVATRGASVIVPPVADVRAAKKTWMNPSLQSCLPRASQPYVDRVTKNTVSFVGTTIAIGAAVTYTDGMVIRAQTGVEATAGPMREFVRANLDKGRLMAVSRLLRLPQGRLAMREAFENVCYSSSNTMKQGGGKQIAIESQKKMHEAPASERRAEETGKHEAGERADEAATTQRHAIYRAASFVAECGGFATFETMLTNAPKSLKAINEVSKGDKVFRELPSVMRATFRYVMARGDAAARQVLASSWNVSTAGFGINAGRNTAVLLPVSGMLVLKQSVKDALPAELVKLKADWWLPSMAAGMVTAAMTGTLSTLFNFGHKLAYQANPEPSKYRIPKLTVVAREAWQELGWRLLLNPKSFAPKAGGQFMANMTLLLCIAGFEKLFEPTHDVVDDAVPASRFVSPLEYAKAYSALTSPTLFAAQRALQDRAQQKQAAAPVASEEVSTTRCPSSPRKG